MKISKTIFRKITKAYTKVAGVRRKRSSVVTPAQLQQLRAKSRQYDMGETNRLLQDWPTSGGTADSDIYSYLRPMRTRSRHLVKNNDYAKRFFNLLKSNVVGPTGIKLQARTRNAKGELDKTDNNYLESEFAKWCKKGVCTADGRLSFTDCQNVFIESIARDGEVIVRKLKGWKENKNRFAIQFIEPDFLDHEINQRLANGNTIRLGVELDKWRRPVAYHFRKRSETLGMSVLSESTEIYDRHERIPADQIIHEFVMDRINQSRGVPWMHTAAKRLQMLGGYEEAELVASRTAAAKMGFFKSEPGEEFVGDDDDADEPTKTPIMNAEPGTFEELPGGMDFVKWDPDHPVAAYESFILAILRGVASGLNVGYVSLANDLRGVSYSSIRQGELTERDAWKMIQGFVIDHFLTDIWENWLTLSLTAGALNIPMSKFDKFNSVIWRGRRWQWVDPLKEVKANQYAVQNGFKSPQEIVSETGGDYYEVIDETKAAMEYAENAGLSLVIFQNSQETKNAKGY